MDVRIFASALHNKTQPEKGKKERLTKLKARAFQLVELVGMNHSNERPIPQFHMSEVWLMATAASLFHDLESGKKS